MSANPQAEVGFKAPGNPAIPQDLALIMEMVAEQNGTAQPIGTATEARAALEKAGTTSVVEPSTTTASAPAETETDSDSESSVATSEDADDMVEEDSDADSDAGVTTSAPMSAGTHAHLLSQLTSFVQGGSSSNAGQNMADSDDEDFIMSEPLATEHEVPLPTVVAPPIERVPAQEKRVLAGSVMSWLPAKGVVEWLKVKQEAADEAAKEEAAVAEAVVPSEAEVQEEIETELEAETEAGVKTDAGAAPSAQPQEVTQSIQVESENVKVDIEQPSPSKLDKGKGKAVSKFPSSGTVVIRAIHNPQASAGDGWLEEGSLLCWEDGRVLGTVSETFGPLTSPFYQVRVAPPPFPFPSTESLEPGTKLYYPHTSRYRSFVPTRMLQTDPRYKGSDASNRYDEEVGEDEMEWSDDEMEAAAKRGKKQRKGKLGRAGSATPSASGGGGFQHPLPARPHFDHEGGEDEPLMYDEMDAGSDWGGSEAGSNAGGRARPAPYEVEDVNVRTEQPAQRGQAERRGRGRGGKASRGRGGGRPQQQERQAQPLPPRPVAPHGLPPNPMAGQSTPPFQQYQQHQQMSPAAMQQQAFHQQQMQQQQMQMMAMQQQYYGFPQGYGFMPMQQQQMGLQQYPGQMPMQQQQQQQQQPQQPVAPAINPRFAAQYQHMMQKSGQGPPAENPS